MYNEKSTRNINPMGLGNKSFVLGNLIFENYLGYDVKDEFGYVYNDKGAMITSIPKSEVKIDTFTFPSKLDDKNVILLSRLAYQSVSYIKKIILPTGLISIPDFAFNRDGSFLEPFDYIFVPNTVKKLEFHSIWGYYDRPNVKFEDGTILETWDDSFIKGDAFNDIKTKDRSYENTYIDIKITSKASNKVYIHSAYKRDKLEHLYTLNKGETIVHK